MSKVASNEATALY